MSDTLNSDKSRSSVTLRILLKGEENTPVSPS